MKFPRLIRVEGPFPVFKTEPTEKSRLSEMTNVKVQTDGAKDSAEKQESGEQWCQR